MLPQLESAINAGLHSISALHMGEGRGASRARTASKLRFIVSCAAMTALVRTRSFLLTFHKQYGFKLCSA
jgi:hypothetical protein